MKSQKELERYIKHCNKKYREGNPIITDSEYDIYIEQLRNRFPNSKLLKNGVIEEVKISRKEKLPIPMFSLNKCKSFDELALWLRSNNIFLNELLVITPKYDGISLVVREENGACWTRGDGEVGQISDKHFGFTKNPVSGKYFYSFGEAIISKKNFEKYDEKFANARNLVAGLFNRDEPIESLKDVDYMRYGSDEIFKDKIKQLENINKSNVVKVPFCYFSFSELNPTFLDTLYYNWLTDYNIDGLVIEVNNQLLRNTLGREENNNPKYARAYKNPEWSGSVKSTVTGVSWKVSKQGKLKPVINIKPIETGGVTISNVTGYNANYISEHNIAKGSVIKITRSGDVIPKHLETLSFDKNEYNELWDNLVECPCCGELTKWDILLVELICLNEFCDERVISKLVHFFNVLGVEDFGEPSVISLFNEGFNTYEKILYIEEKELSNIEGWGIKSAKSLISQFDKLKETGVSFAKLLHAFDVMEGKLGEKMIQLILDNYDISEGIDICSVEELEKIEGVAQISATVYKNGLTRFFTMFNQLKMSPIPILNFKSIKKEITGSKYEGVKVCFSGVRPSKEQQNELESGGGEVVSGVSKNTTHLVVKDLSDKVLSSSKSKKAKSLGIKILQISEFFI